MKSFDIVVIGGGPAGIFAAATASNKGKSVLLLDKNNILGRKLRITGKGRCNITNAAEISEFFENIPTNPKFLYSALYGFTGQNMISFLEKQGVPCKTERGARVFPVSDKAHDVANALADFVKKSGVTVYQSKAKDVAYEDGKICGVITDKGKIDCDAVIIATGGMSYPLTGSTGDGYRFAEKAGHTIISPRGALVPMESDDMVCAELKGLTLKNVSVTMTDLNGKSIGEEFGELLFAHFGLTGPVILSLSSWAPRNEDFIISIDLKPALSDEQLDARILRDFAKFSNKQLCNALVELLPKSMIEPVLKKAELDSRKVVNTITKKERQALLYTLKNFKIKCKGLRPIEEAIVTGGGVCVKEVNPSTMESKIIKGLYFAGEVLDVDAYTGGFNLQIAYSTGILAGENAAN